MSSLFVALGLISRRDRLGFGKRHREREREGERGRGRDRESRNTAP
jgi:hypothetical protein